MIRYLFLLLLMAASAAHAQVKEASTSRAHSHNDYEQPFPFWQAWRQGFGSIEADIFLDNGQLIVAHDRIQVKKRVTLDSLYLKPLVRCIQQNGGQVYADSGRTLQLMIDVKTEAVSTLDQLVQLLQQYPLLTQCASLKIVISGNQPAPATFPLYPSWLYFDGSLHYDYKPAELAKVEMLSDNFARYTRWNGKGRIPEKELDSLQQMIRHAHSLGKKIRFWNAPDILNSWYTFLNLGVDYLNTDDINGISVFLQQLPDREYVHTAPHALYAPQWKNDGIHKPVKNVILIVGDGTGLAQWYAAYTANRGQLNVFNMRYTGLSKTSSYDNYITDSAPGATAFSSGHKTNNRAVGVDHTGKALELLPAMLHKKGMRTGVITSGDIRDATPASFYAQQQERSSYAAILEDLSQSSLDLVMGSCDFKAADSTITKLKQKYQVARSIDSLPSSLTKPLLLADEQAALAVLGGRGQWLPRAFTKATQLLGNKNGFFLMLEGAQVDHGGHANQLPYAVSELLDLDQVIAKAMEFADSNGETLVIVTADHETGGLTLTAGDYSTGRTGGQFSTGDHTAIPVPVFAYGPRSYLFSGVFENTEIFRKILAALSIKEPGKGK